MPDHWSDLSKPNPKPLTKSRLTIAAALLAEVGQKASRGLFRNPFKPISRNLFVQVKYNQAPKSRFFVADVLGISWHKVGHLCVISGP
jgi:hypothetical protein